MEVDTTQFFSRRENIYMLYDVSYGYFLKQVIREICITFRKCVVCDSEETTHYGLPTVSGRDIFISSH